MEQDTLSAWALSHMPTHMQKEMATLQKQHHKAQAQLQKTYDRMALLSRQKAQLDADEAALRRQLHKQQKKWARRLAAQVRAHMHQPGRMDMGLVDAHRRVVLRQIAKSDVASLSALRHSGSTYASVKERLVRETNALAYHRAQEHKDVDMVLQQRERLQKLADMMRQALGQSDLALQPFGSTLCHDSFGPSFSARKGTLRWPMHGQILSEGGATTKKRRGLKILAHPGAVARSVADGKVVFADLLQGFGKVIIVDHGQGYHTTVAGLEQVVVRPGARVLENQHLGTLGGVQNGAVLHFEVRHQGDALDPTDWLGRPFSAE